MEGKAFKPFARVTPVRQGEAIRYTLTIDGGSGNDRLELYARKMSEGNFLPRYAGSDGVREPSLKESGLAFLSVRDGRYYLLTSISKEETLREIFPQGPLPQGTGLSDLRLETMEQAVAISAWLDANFQRLAEDKDFSQFRVVP